LAETALLIWYLDSGRRRDYRILERPDQITRNKPAPDFLIKDVVTGHEIATELTSLVLVRDMEGSLPVKRRAIRYVRELINELVEEIPAGEYHVSIGSGSLRGRDFGEAMLEMAGNIARAARSLRSIGSAVVLNTAFAIEVRLVRQRSDVLVRIEPEEEYTREQRVKEIIRQSSRNSATKDSWENLYRTWRIPDEIGNQLLAALTDTERKFADFQGQTTAMLASFPHSIMSWHADLYEDRIATTYQRGYSKLVHRFYLLCQDDDSFQFRIRRVW
jgi:hypothetical protein